MSTFGQFLYLDYWSSKFVRRFRERRAKTVEYNQEYKTSLTQSKLSSTTKKATRSAKLYKPIASKRLLEQPKPCNVVTHPEESELCEIPRLRSVDSVPRAVRANRRGIVKKKKKKKKGRERKRKKKRREKEKKGKLARGLRTMKRLDLF